VREEMMLHEAAVAGRMPGRQTVKFVEIERGDAREIQLAGRGQGAQMRVQVHGGTARWKAKHGRRVGGDELRHAKSHSAGHGVVVGEDVYLHGR
jgi:hypothetical protein